MKGLMVHRGKSYLPELNAYKQYFATNGIDFSHTAHVEDENLSQYDIIWLFAGIDPIKKDIFRVHDYRSLSIPPYGYLKDKLKKFINPKPNMRVFLNEYVQSGFSFDDDVPSTRIDMGIDEQFFIVKKSEPIYKFVYVGDVVKARWMDQFLRSYVTGKLKHEKLLLVGSVEDEIYKEFSSCKNLHFTGKVEQSAVADNIALCEYGINFIPPLYPYSVQTSTKLLEYCAMGLKIVTTDSFFIRRFMMLTGARFFLIKKASTLNMDDIDNYDYNIPEVSAYKWEKILNSSSVIDLIQKGYGRSK